MRGPRSWTTRFSTRMGSSGSTTSCSPTRFSSTPTPPSRGVPGGAGGIGCAAKKGKGKSGVLNFGGGSPKNFMLQTEPQLQEVMGIAEKGHDFFLQVTDARPDTGGLSGATPSEAVSWGKVDPDRLPDAVVCYLDSTVAMPLLTAYALDRAKRRPLKRLYDRRDEFLATLGKKFRRDYIAWKAGGKRRPDG